MSDDLIAFVEARLAEDESVALAASGSTPRLQKVGFSAHWHTEPWYDGTGEHCVLRAGVAGDLTAPGGIEVQAGEHAARHDPSRVLRDVGALRAVVEERKSTMEWVQELRREGEPSEAYARHVGSLLGVLKTFAAVWREHPDFRAEWSPTDA